MNDETAYEYDALRTMAMPRYSGLVTFFRLPPANEATGLEIAVCGVPFDNGMTNKVGARHGPRQVRDMSCSHIRRYHPTSRRAAAEECAVADLGDVPINPVNQLDSLARIEAFFAHTHEAGAVPLAAGGDHLITLPILRVLGRDRPVGLVHFDAHVDTYDTGISGDYDNGMPFRRAVEEGVLDPKRSIQIGIRGSTHSRDDADFSYSSGMRVVTIDEYFELGNEAVVEEARRVVGDDPTYVSFDVDALDPACAPGTGAPEVGGFSVRDAQVMIRGLAGLDLIGADMVEVAPPLDPLGGTAIVGANIMFELMDVLAAAAIARRG